MTFIAAVPIDKSAVTFGPVSVPDDEHTVTLSFANWSDPAATIAFAVELSLDGGATWQQLAAMTAAGGPADKRGPVGMTLLGVSVLCGQCGAEYIAGDGRFDRALSHSTVTLKQGKTLLDIAARTGKATNLAAMKTAILVDGQGRDVDDQYLVRTFHTPTPGVNPARLLRGSVTMTGAPMSSVLTVVSAPLPAATAGAAKVAG